LLLIRQPDNTMASTIAPLSSWLLFLDELALA
jgi:hypothetical protein